MHSSAPVTVAEQQVASLGTKRTLAFITPDPAAGTPKRPSSSARELLTAHLTKLFSLSPTLTLADGSTRALRILSLHPAHLFRAGTLLTGTLYLTTTHVLFYAYLRPRAPKLADALVAATRDERMVRLRCNKPTRHQRSPSAAIYLNAQLPILCLMCAQCTQVTDPDFRARMSSSTTDDSTSPQLLPQPGL
ncbi:hypothetical protein OC844_006105 [Tilletia horrida]|nr:hypothetical protein OC844_006105 [Tilletia horrida]